LSIPPDFFNSFLDYLSIYLFNGIFLMVAVIGGVLSFLGAAFLSGTAYPLVIIGIRDRWDNVWVLGARGRYLNHSQKFLTFWST